MIALYQQPDIRTALAEHLESEYGAEVPLTDTAREALVAAGTCLEQLGMPHWPDELVGAVAGRSLRVVGETVLAHTIETRMAGRLRRTAGTSSPLPWNLIARGLLRPIELLSAPAPAWCLDVQRIALHGAETLEIGQWHKMNWALRTAAAVYDETQGRGTILVVADWLSFAELKSNVRSLLLHITMKRGWRAAPNLFCKNS